jgi:hypothetical protein
VHKHDLCGFAGFIDTLSFVAGAGVSLLLTLLVHPTH